MFETLMQMLRTLEAVEDVYVEVEGGDLSLTFHDFSGFDAHWCEVMRDYELPALVDEVFELLDSCPCEGDFYVTYYVDGHAVEVGYSSMDI